MSNHLREYIKSILREEIVSIRRSSGEESTYNVTFDKKSGEIVRGKKYKVSPEKMSIIEKSQVKKYTNIPDAQILMTIDAAMKAGGAVQAPLRSVKQAVTEMNQPHWLEAIEWPSTGRVGKGEAAMHLAFESDLSAKEPDFVSSTGIKMSIKHFGSGGGTVKSGDSENVKKLCVTLLNELKGLTGLDLTTQSTASGIMVKEHMLNVYKKNLEPKKRAADIRNIAKRLRNIVDELMENIASEHDAAGILVLRTGEAAFLQASNWNLLQLDAIREGNRAQFGYGPWMTENRSSWQRELDKLSKVTPEQLKGSSDEKAAPESPGKLRSIATSWDRRPGTGRVG